MRLCLSTCFGSFYYFVETRARARDTHTTRVEHVRARAARARTYEYAPAHALAVGVANALPRLGRALQPLDHWVTRHSSARLGR